VSGGRAQPRARDPAAAAGKDANLQQSSGEAAIVTDASAVELSPTTALELARLLAHETRTPLHAIRGFAELLLGGAAGPLGADALDYVRQIAQAGRVLEAALALAQEIGELDADGPSPCRQPVDVGTILRALGFAWTGLGLAEPLPLILGEPAAWLRVGQACRDYLQGTDRGSAVLTAEARLADEGALEVVLRRSDIHSKSDVGLLGMDLARRSVMRQGGWLRAIGVAGLLLTWPRDVVLGTADTSREARRDGRGISRKGG
jgi:hypothetical protein